MRNLYGFGFQSKLELMRDAELNEVPESRPNREVAEDLL
jgi:hypothetical protein